MKILVVEDDPELADLLRRVLSEKLHRVEVLWEGESARHRALSEEFDLILLDLMIPRLDGIAVCRALRSAGKLPPVIMGTARDRFDDRVLGLDAGADDYLIKPFSLNELFARMRAVRRRVEQRGSEVLRVGALALDPSREYVELNSRKVLLTAKEFALLKFFMQHPNRVLSRADILEHVWDSNFEGLGNVVDVYVNYLRNKLEAEGEPRVLETVRGRGYVLKETSFER